MFNVEAAIGCNIEISRLFDFKIVSACAAFHESESELHNFCPFDGGKYYSRSKYFPNDSLIKLVNNDFDLRNVMFNMNSSCGSHKMKLNGDLYLWNANKLVIGFSVSDLYLQTFPGIQDINFSNFKDIEELGKKVCEFGFENPSLHIIVNKYNGHKNEYLPR